MTDGRTIKWARYAVLVPLALGIWARTHNLFRTPMWLDEAYSRFAAEHGWWFLWHTVPRYETHPPFYYSLLHVWQSVAGESLLAYRLPGLLCGLATIAIIGVAASALARALSAAQPTRTVLICYAIGCAALSPMLIAMSRQVRPYAPMILVYAVATLAVLRLGDAAARNRPLPRCWIVGFFVAEALMLWLHALGPLFAVAMSCALAIAVARRSLTRTDWAWLAAGQILAASSFLPAVAILRAEAPAWIHSTWLIFDVHSLPRGLSTLFAGPWKPLGAYALLAFAAGLAQFFRLRHAYRIGAALLVLTMLPVILSLLVSWWISPIFLPRTLSPTVVPFTLGIAMLATNERLRLAGPVLIALLLALSVRYDFDENAGQAIEAWDRAAAWLAPKVPAGDAVWAYPNETALPLGYALTDQHRGLAIRQIPAPVPALDYPGDHPTGTAGVVALRPAQIEQLAADPATAKPRAIWLVGLGAERMDPDGRLLAALTRRRAVARHYEDSELRIVELIARPSASTPGRAAPAGAAAAR